MIQKLLKVLKAIEQRLEKLEHYWMDIVREEQDEYNKPIRLNPNDGSDWRRELL